MRPRQISVCRSKRSHTAQASSRRARNSIVLMVSLSGSGSSSVSTGGVGTSVGAMAMEGVARLKTRSCHGAARGPHSKGDES